MSFSGMDIAVVRDIARRLDGQAGQLEQVQRLVEAGIVDCQRSWRGPDVDRFAQEWNGRTRPSMCRLAAELRDLASAARRNADEQDRVSNAYAEGGAGAPSASPTATVIENSPNPWVEAFGRVGEKLYDSNFSSLLGAVSAADHLVGLDNLGEVDHLRKLPFPMVDVLRGAGTALGAFAMASDMVELVDAAGRGDAGAMAYSAANGVADCMKMSSDPELYLTGVAISAISWDIKAASELDWDWNSETNRIIRDPGHFMDVVLGVEHPSSDPLVFAAQVADSGAKMFFQGAQRALSFF